MEIKPQLSLVIFTHDKYMSMLPTVLEGTKNIQDTITSKYIVSPNSIDIPGYTNINDDYLWNLFDPTFRYKRFYDKNWYKQQILKLNLDFIEEIEDNILILDGDAVITKSMRFLENGKINYYMAGEYDRSFFNCNKILIGLNKNKQDSFISEAMIFHKEMLKSLKYYIRDFNKGEEWLSVVERVVDQSLSNPIFCTTEVLSEYELYGSYITEWYSDYINKYIPPYMARDYQKRLNVFDWKNKTAKELYEFICNQCPHIIQSISYK